MSQDKPSREELELRIQELESENKILSDFAELSSEWFWEQDSHFRFTRFYGFSLSCLQRDQALFLGKVRWEMPVEGITEEELQAHIDCCKQHCSFRDFEYSVPGNNNKLQRYSISGTPFYDSQGNFAGYRGIGKNITELHTARLERLESQERLIQILQGSPIATFVINKNHEITHWNKACETLTGYLSEDKLGEKDSWRGFYPEPRPTLADLVVDELNFDDIKEHYGSHLTKSALIPGACEAESFFPKIGKNGLWLHFNASPLFDHNGNINGAIETLQDITSRVIAENTEREHHKALQVAHTELKATIQQLAEAKKIASLSRLISGMAHELNTPLGNMRLGSDSILSTLQNLQKSYQEQTLTKASFESFLENSFSALSIIEQSLKRSTNLISRFKELSQDTSTEKAVRFYPAKIINHLFMMFSSHCHRQNIQLVNNIDEGLPLRSYPKAFEQVIYCLLENSLNHGLPEGGGIITLDTERSMKGIKFSFSDNGKGMSDDIFEHAFDPFYTSNLGKGTSGLGLYRVYNLINTMMGGFIELKSNNPGLRTEFFLPDIEE